MGLLQETQQNYYDGNDFGGYQFVSLDDIITNFTIAYVGENKIIPKIKRTDIAFHAQRAMQELSFDTFKSIKSQEITLPPSLTMALPQDYVNYTKICWTDTAGIEHPLYPTRHTSNPTPVFQNADGEYKLTAIGTLEDGSDIVVLDKEYKNIIVGMRVASPSIPSNTFVGSTSNDSSITTITLVDKDGVSVNATYTGNETLHFKNSDMLLVIEEESSFILENVTWSNGSNKITQSPNTDVSNIKVGMLVSHEDFDQGTIVVSVNGAVITTSTNSNATSSSPDEVTFISTPGDSETWGHYKSHDATTNSMVDEYDYDDDIYELNVGGRYGLEPAHAQVNGSYYIDNLKGLIHFSSNVSGKTVILKYISDGLGTDDEMIVHKFAEEAMYKSIAYAVLSTSSFGQPLVPRFKKEKFAAIRTAKLRLSNLKLDELAQSLRGKSKIIKH